MMTGLSRRALLAAGLASATAALAKPAGAQPSASQPIASDKDVCILHPRARVPLSFFIDDSTCLVNMGHFCMPQFAEAWPNQKFYKKPWKTWPREIPDTFVREFGEFCGEQGVKGKYSIVPNPACVGWLDRELPGWSRRELQESLKLVRELMMPNWDIHPEMITHTRVIDLKTGRPMEAINAGTMENSYPQADKSVDELAEYIATALRVLKNCGLPCEGITTPGGFGNRHKSELSLAVGQAVRDVFNPEIVHYFKYVKGQKESVEPQLEHLKGADTDRPSMTVNVPCCTGDWFGDWDGDAEPRGHLYSNDDATAGRMVEVIERGDPAIMLCHWPGLYSQGTKKGFEHFKKVAKALNTRFGQTTQWMKITEIARYWAARQLTEIGREGERISLRAPFACPAFTMKIDKMPAGALKVVHAGKAMEMREVGSKKELRAGTWVRDGEGMVLCFDLAKGRTTVGAG